MVRMMSGIPLSPSELLQSIDFDAFSSFFLTLPIF
jgi:hypothetical protein